MKSTKNQVFGLLFLTILVSACNKEKSEAPLPKTSTATPKRVYFIAAEEQIWDYAPEAKNVFMGMPYTANDSVYGVHLPTGPTFQIGSKNIKARYVEYTDSTFKTPKPIASEWKHLGILGPVIRASVGDSVIVYFKNKTTIHTSIHVHGLLYDVNSEGSVYNNGATSGADIAPNGKHMYKFFAREGSGPGAAQGSSVVWLYHSHVDMEESDLYAGLIGAIIVTKKGMGDINAKPKDVDREFVTLFMVLDENHSAFLNKNIQTFCPGLANPANEDFVESNKKHSINGMFMGNLPGLVMKKGEKVRWYVLGLGNEVDLHTPHWHGNSVSISGQNTDVLELLPAAMLTADMKPDNAGTWAFHCHVTDHMKAGMTALYKVE